MPIVGVNHCLPILYIYKIMVHFYTTENIIHQFSIGCIINSSLHINRIFREPVQTFLDFSLSTKTMKNIRDCLMENNTSVIVLIILYENSGKYIRKLYIVFSCVVYNLIYNYVCIEYLFFQSKILCGISSNPTFKETDFNLSLGVGISELLLNLLTCHGFMKKSNWTVILNCQSRLINNYSSKVFFVIEQGSKHLVWFQMMWDW